MRFPRAAQRIEVAARELGVVAPRGVEGIEVARELGVVALQPLVLEELQVGVLVQGIEVGARGLGVALYPLLKSLALLFLEAKWKGLEVAPRRAAQRIGVGGREFGVARYPLLKSLAMLFLEALLELDWRLVEGIDVAVWELGFVASQGPAEALEVAARELGVVAPRGAAEALEVVC